MNTDTVIARLHELSNQINIAGMARFGICPSNILGVRKPELRQLAKSIGSDHGLALELWQTGIHEARILACYIDIPELVTPEQMDSWCHDFDSWDICDQCTGNLFDRTQYAEQKIFEWSVSGMEYVKRAAFALIAWRPVHLKKLPDSSFVQFFDLIEAHASDNRTYVKKAVNWALRQLGKRSLYLHEKAVETSHKIYKQDSPASRWVAADALRELQSPKVMERLLSRQA